MIWPNVFPAKCVNAVVKDRAVVTLLASIVLTFLKPLSYVHAVDIPMDISKLINLQRLVRTNSLIFMYFITMASFCDHDLQTLIFISQKCYTASSFVIIVLVLGMMQMKVFARVGMGSTYILLFKVYLKLITAIMIM